MKSEPLAQANPELWARLVEYIEERSNPTRQSPEAVAAYRTLAAAMEHHRPACSDDHRFTGEKVALQTRPLAAVCDRCPIRRECGDYAGLAQPKSGYWAGQTYDQETP